MISKINKLSYFASKSLSVVYFKLLLSWRLRSCGKKSYIVNPLILFNPHLVDVGSNVRILDHSRIEIQDNAVFTVGNNVSIGHNFFVSAYRSVEIMDGTLISDNVAIIDNSHIAEVNVPPSFGRVSFSSIKIGKNVTIYRNTTILEGAVIGDGCVIAAGSLVSGVCQPRSVYAGKPAVFKKKLFDAEL